MKKAVYILKVKDKQKDLKNDIKTYFDWELKNDSPDIDILETPYEKEHGKILTIFLMILIAYITRKNGNQLEQLEEWMFIEKKMVK